MKTKREFSTLTRFLAKFLFLIFLSGGLLAFTGCSSSSESSDEDGEGMENGKANGSPSTVVNFDAIYANGGDEDGKDYKTTALTLHFNKEISGLTASDITFTDTGSTGAKKVALTGEGPTYTLAVSGITKTGTVKVTVAKKGYTVSPTYKEVTVYSGGEPAEVKFKLMADGNVSEATTELTLKFNPSIPNLTGEDVMFNPGETGATAGESLTNAYGTGQEYTLAVSGITKTANVSVTLKKPGYMFTENSKQSVKVWADPSASATQTITDLDLTNYIPAPEEGKSPRTTFTPAASPAQYTVGKVDWDPTDSTFQAGSTYTAKVTLTANPGYTFTGSENYLVHAEAYSNDGNPISTTNASEDALTVTVWFRQLDNPSPTNTWYVSGTGNDAENNSGTSYAYPLKTINAALKRAKDAKTDNNSGIAEIILISSLDTDPNTNPNSNNDSSDSGQNRIGPITSEHPHIILRGYNSSEKWIISMKNGGRTWVGTGYNADTVANDILLSVGEGGDLTLKDITLIYDGETGNAGTGLIRVTGSGSTGTAHLTFESGVSIEDAKKDGNGSGVLVESGGVFTMYKGSISGNTSKGGSVYVMEGSKFVMNGGIIEGNNAYYIADGGGGGVLNNGTFEMNGGMIAGNTAHSSGSGDGGNGGGVLNKGTFTMNGGIIAGNTSGSYGGGVFSVKSPGFIKTGGTIYGSDVADGSNHANFSGQAVHIHEGPQHDKTAWPNDVLNSGSTNGWEYKE